MMVILLTAVAGGLGAAARFGLDTALARLFPTGWARLMIINGSGSLLLGTIAGLAVGRAIGLDLQLILGAGFLGGYTTFSAASLATVQLVEEHRWPASLLSSIGMLAGSAAGAALGLVVGWALS